MAGPRPQANGLLRRVRLPDADPRGGDPPRFAARHEEADALPARPRPRDLAKRPVRVFLNVLAGDRNQIVTTHGDVDTIARFRPEEASA